MTAVEITDRKQPKLNRRQRDMALMSLIIGITAVGASWIGIINDYLTALEFYTLPILSVVSVICFFGYLYLPYKHLGILDAFYKVVTGGLLIGSQVEAALSSQPNNLGFYMIWIASYYIMLMFADVKQKGISLSYAYFLISAVLVFVALILGPHAFDSLTGMLLLNTVLGQSVVVIIYRYVTEVIKKSAIARANAQASEERATELTEVVERAEVARRQAEEAHGIAQKARRQAEEAREEAERASAAKSSFVANMSHELRTPLNAIIGFSDMLRQHEELKLDKTKALGYGQDIYVSGRHLLSIVNDMLDMAKIEAGAITLVESEFKILDIADTIMGAVKQLAKSEGLDIDLSALSATDHEDAPAAITLKADKRLVTQMLLNLLSNSIKYTEAPGAVTLEIECCINNQLRFTVRDTGIGMDEETVRSVLEPFVQAEDVYAREKGGTGLGLYLVDNMVRLHGGSMKIDSTVGKGTVVELTFPAERVK